MQVRGRTRLPQLWAVKHALQLAGAKNPSISSRPSSSGVLVAAAPNEPVRRPCILFIHIGKAFLRAPPDFSFAR